MHCLKENYPFSMTFLGCSQYYFRILTSPKFIFIMASGKRFDNVSAAEPPPPYAPTDQNQDIQLFGNLTVHRHYVKSIPGILKAVGIVLCIIILICVGSGSYSSSYLQGVTVWVMVWTIVLYVIFAARINEKIRFVHWPGTDFLFMAAHCLILAIASIIAAANGGEPGDWAATAFGLITAAVYGYSCYLAFHRCKNYVQERRANSHVTTRVTTVQHGNVVTEQTVTTTTTQ